jgi:hypothetical protein
MMPPIDFDAINDAALRRACSLLPDLVPGGKFRGLEYEVLNPRRNDQRRGSFKINYRTGAWSDFATGDKGGDIISWFAYARGLNQGEAARELAAKLGLPMHSTSNGSHASGITPTTPTSDSASQPAPAIHPWGDEGPRDAMKLDATPTATVTA